MEYYKYVTPTIIASATGSLYGSIMGAIVVPAGSAVAGSAIGGPIGLGVGAGAAIIGTAFYVIIKKMAKKAHRKKKYTTLYEDQ